jgi:hypothetical protein
MSDLKWHKRAVLIAAAVTILALVLFGAIATSLARPSVQWAQSSPERQEWFERAQRPGTGIKDEDRWHSTQSCCAENADAYEADEFETEDGELFATITKGSKDIPAGIRVHIPKDKIITDLEFLRKNPTGHGWVWMIGGGVLCYVLPSGG